MKKRILSLLLILCLLTALMPGAFAAPGCVEVDSAAALMEALAEKPAVAMRAAETAAEPARVLLLSQALPDPCGADRVLHYGAYDEYILEFSSRAAAEAAYETLTGTYGFADCWLDTPENAATVMDGESNSVAWGSYGGTYMHLNAYRSDAYTAKHFAAQDLTVAIIDTGADLTIPALWARASMCYDFVNNTPELTDLNGSKSRGHGTGVASLLDTLLPQNVKFMMLRVFNKDGEASATHVRTALQYAVENGASVINMSLGWEGVDERFHPLDDVLEQANRAGITVVCAAGNKQAYVDTSYPARHGSTIAVGSVDKRLVYEEKYSNYGPLLDFCGPGCGVATKTIGGSSTYATGTSLAAPHITAAAAQLKLCEPAAAPLRIYAMLRTYARDLGIAGKDNLYGWGIPVLPERLSDYMAHTWDAGRTTQVSTTTAAGTRTFTCTVCGKERTETIPAAGGTDSGFADVEARQFYAAPVAWAVENGVTNGTSATAFSPEAVCTRAHVVTFLWRAMGSPTPNHTDNPFVDVAPGAYYYNAVLWAVEKGITNGTSATTFSPNATCTRGHVVTFLWRTMEQPAGGGENPFADVPQDAYYTDAVQWAVKTEVTNGTSGTTFSPNAGCTRGQVVTFLYRMLA